MKCLRACGCLGVARALRNAETAQRQAVVHQGVKLPLAWGASKAAKGGILLPQCAEDENVQKNYGFREYGGICDH